MNEGVTCSRCGGSTPLPTDLRVPSFRCSACGAELATAQYLHQDIASAEQFRAYLQNPQAGQAPRYVQTNTATRAASCRHCNAAIHVPLTLHEKSVTCPACHRTDPVTAYISEQERFALEMQRQLSGNQALAELRAKGALCHRCGANNPVNDPTAVQIVCAYCKAAILLSDHVSGDAVARARLRQGLFAMRDNAVNAQRAQDRKVVFLVVGIFAVAAIGLAIAGLLGAFHQH